MKILGIKQYGIHKYQEGTNENGIQLNYTGPQYYEMMEKLRKENPMAYNRLQQAALEKSSRLKLIPKAKSGWTTYLNPKNWGVTDYDTKEFSEAFAKARQVGDEEFLWNGNKYHTRLIKPESQKSFDDQYNWIKDKINNLTADDIKLNEIDSIDAKVYAGRKDIQMMDSLGHKYFEKYKYYQNLQPQYEHHYLDSIKNARVSNIKDRFSNFNKKNLVVTDEPKKGYNTMGYYDNKTGKMYLNLNSPGTAVHEFSHQSRLDELPQIRINKEQYRKALLESVKHTGYMQPKHVNYSSSSYEIGARLLQNQYLLQGKNYQDSKSILESNPVDAVLYNENNFKNYFK